MMGDGEHHRHSIRLQGYDYSAAGGYFVTVVAYQRKCLFGDLVGGEVRLTVLGRIVNECWNEIPNHFPNAEVDAFIIMPNHVHGIIILHENDEQTLSKNGRGTIYRAPTGTIEKFGKPTIGSLPTIIRTFKAAVSRRAGRELNISSIWQRNFYEHIIRSQDDYESIAGYIKTNPETWHLDDENPSQPQKSD